MTMHDTDQELIDPAIAAEREYMDDCRAAIGRMRDEATTALATRAGEGDAIVDKYNNHMLRQFRIKQLKDLADLEDVPLFFARLQFPPGDIYDTAPAESALSAPDGDRVYIGRRGVTDESGEFMVIDWRAPLSRAFYEASHEHPMGVRVRRRYGFDHHGALTAYEDEPLDRIAAADGSGLLAAEIERPRKGPMRDIVATIQPEQMSLVRAPLSRTLCIQGAPGTGKTAVGLHRLAYLLFTERELLRKEGGVAVIGPNRSFLSYVRNVLPALGEVDVLQTTIDDLAGADIEIAVGRADEPRAALVKGDARMAEVVRRHLWSRVRPFGETLEVKHLHRTFRVHADEVAEELAGVQDRGTEYGAGLELIAQRLATRVLRQIEEDGEPVTASTQRRLRRNPAITRAVQHMWPKVEPVRLVFDLLTDPEQLARAADGILSADEQRAVLRTPRPRGVPAMTWSSLDLALIDEARSLIEHPAKLGHIVIDEAQDLSPMQFRAIARRVVGSCTVLGDLAQSTSPAAVEDWPTVLTHLGRPDGRIEELGRGYRVPAQVIDYAARLLSQIAPELSSPSSFRQSADALRITETTQAEMTETIVKSVAAAVDEEGSVGLIAADGDIAALRTALSDSGLEHTVLGADGASMDDTRLTLIPVTLAKGLEFDTVLVVEPVRIVEAEERGLQRLYVALTRAVSNLHIIHAEPLPEALAQHP